MSQENVRIVRQPMAVALRSRRRLEERLGLRFPDVIAFLVGLVWRLPPYSRLRQAFLRHAATMGCEAANRGDFEATFVLYDQQVELVPDPRFVDLGFDGVYRGRAERIRFQQRWSAESGYFQFAPEELIDLGDGSRRFPRADVISSFSSTVRQVQRARQRNSDTVSSDRGLCPDHPRRQALKVLCKLRRRRKPHDQVSGGTLAP